MIINKIFIKSMKKIHKRYLKNNFYYKVKKLKINILFNIKQKEK